MDEREKAIALAGSLGRAVDIVLAAEDVSVLGSEETVVAVNAVAEWLFTAQVELFERLVGSSPPSARPGGRTWNGGRSSASKPSSGGSTFSDGPSDKQVDFFEKLIDAIEKAGGEAPYTLGEFRNATPGRDGTASAMIDELKDLRDELRG